ncbi:MAG: response regulator, partial [Clostridia bacterium]|nr:response regulator [Clostridia bacterium]
MRRVVGRMLTEDGFQVVGTARNGLEALALVSALRPDVVTLDVEMPVLDGLSTLERLMKSDPVPVVMLSSLTQPNAEATIRALTLGAVDFVPKPSGSVSLDIGRVR